MPNEDYITSQDITLAEQAKLALMAFERKAGRTMPDNTINVDGPAAFQQVARIVGGDVVPVESTSRGYTHVYVKTDAGVRFWHAAKKA